MASYDRVIVTGGSGRVGRYVVDELVKAGHGVTVFDLGPPKAGVAHVKGDILDLPALEAAFKGAEAVVHLAANDWIAKVPPEAFIRVNVLGTWQVLQAAESAGVRKAVVCSSISAMGLEELRPEFPPDYLPFDEAHPIKPVEPYSVSKEAVEHVAMSFARRGNMGVVVLRPLGVAVPESLARFVERADDPNIRWFCNYVSPEDTAQAFRLALERDMGRFDLFLIGAADSCAVDSTLEVAKRLFSPFPKIRHPGLYQAHPRASMVDIDHARRRLGYEPTSDWLKLRAGVKR
jgi:nucleoside-diphosphate-sugar epimerase